MPNNLIKIRKYQGIYYLESKKKRYQGRPDRCFYVIYKNRKKIAREKVGWLSEGYNAQLADQIRANRVSNLRHGKELPNRKKRNQHLPNHGKGTMRGSIPAKNTYMMTGTGTRTI